MSSFEEYSKTFLTDPVNKPFVYIAWIIANQKSIKKENCKKIVIWTNFIKNFFIFSQYTCLGCCLADYGVIHLYVYFLLRSLLKIFSVWKRTSVCYTDERYNHVKRKQIKNLRDCMFVR